jgi:hypothetical protein
VGLSEAAWVLSPPPQAVKSKAQALRNTRVFFFMRNFFIVFLNKYTQFLTNNHLLKQSAKILERKSAR